MEDRNEPRVYEIGFQLLPTVPTADLEAELATIKELITSRGGQEIASQTPELMDLAYEMSKTIDNKRTHFSTAYFGWLKFEIDAEMIDEIDAAMAVLPNVLRFILVKTVREDTVAKRQRPTRKPAPTDNPENPAADADQKGDVDEAKLDEKLEAIATEEKEA